MSGGGEGFSISTLLVGDSSFSALNASTARGGFTGAIIGDGESKLSLILSDGVEVVSFDAS